MMETWHWPQFAEAALLMLSVVAAVSKHGESRGTYNGPGAFVGGVIIAWLLWCGGFWG